MIRTVTVSLVAILCISHAATAYASAHAELREEHWFEAMRISRVDSEILYGIALMESGTSFNGMRSFGPWPWAMNINKTAKYYSSREAARKVLAQEVENGNSRVAVGMWQIYLKYNAHYVDDPLDLVDPVTNLRVAALVLRDCGDSYGTLRDVLSCYHSGDVDDAGIAYASRVLALAKRWGQPFRISSVPAEVRFTHNDQLLTLPKVIVETNPTAPPEVVAGGTESEPESSRPSLQTMVAEPRRAAQTSSHEEFIAMLGKQPERAVATPIVMVIE